MVRRPGHASRHQWSRQLETPLAALALFSLLLSACTVHSVTAPSVWAPLEERVPAEEPRHLFVFFDGTKNIDRSGTNVWRLFQLVQSHGPRSTRAFYIEGVGSAMQPVTGMLLGVGMEKRIREGYAFLADHFRPGDQIYIFGFSRGALQARALAGFLAYAGLPVVPEELPSDFDRTVNKMIGIAKGELEATHAPAWDVWTPGTSPPPIAALMTGQTMQRAEVAFLGVWDTVPGSLFKKIDGCYLKKKNGKLKDRYKTDSYPSIRVIAQAVSNDEKRTRFKPLALCPALNGDHTQTHETWFPGAHSDVGGGYEDSRRLEKETSGPPLSALSFNWMVDLLAKSYPFLISPPPLLENAAALAHWSARDFPGNFASRCEDRPRPGNADRHPGLATREASACALVKLKKKSTWLPYPLTCDDALKAPTCKPST
jgi:hypothetical protein